MLQRAHALGPRHEGYLPLLRQAAGASKTHWAAHEVLLRALVDGIIAGRSVDLNKTVYDLDDPAELKEATKHAKVLRKLYKSDKQRYHNLAVEQLPFYFLDAGNRIEGADRPLCALKVGAFLCRSRPCSVVHASLCVALGTEAPACGT